MCLPKRTQTETGPSTGLLPLPRLVLVSPESRWMSVVSTLMKSTHLFGVLHVLSSVLVTGGASTMMVGPSSSSPERMEPPPKKARLRSFLRVSSLYAREVAHCLCGSRFSYFYT
jgi:hypothetical protein